MPGAEALGTAVLFPGSFWYELVFLVSAALAVGLDEPLYTVFALLEVRSGRPSSLRASYALSGTDVRGQYNVLYQRVGARGRLSTLSTSTWPRWSRYKTALSATRLIRIVRYLLHARYGLQGTDRAGMVVPDNDPQY
eukprot:1009768-Rhodomonas_salina.8